MALCPKAPSLQPASRTETKPPLGWRRHQHPDGYDAAYPEDGDNHHARLDANRPQKKERRWYHDAHSDGTIKTIAASA